MQWPGKIVPIGIVNVCVRHCSGRHFGFPICQSLPHCSHSLHPTRAFTRLQLKRLGTSQVVGNTVKHRFQHKLFIIHTVFQCYTDPPSMRMVSSVRYLSLRFLISRLFLIINRFDFLLRSEEWCGRNILTAKSIKCCCKGKDLQYT